MIRKDVIRKELENAFGATFKVKTNAYRAEGWLVVDMSYSNRHLLEAVTTYCKASADRWGANKVQVGCKVELEREVIE